jgi:DNA-binding transcriptional LysR family regulator
MPAAPPLDWNDLRHLLAVAETGSTLAAGRMLGVSQTTSARRIAALEAALGVTLFERSPSGYTLTPEGETLLGDARAIAAAAGRLTAVATAHARAADGAVRVSAGEIDALTVLPPILRDLHLAHPEIRIELDTADTIRDLAAGEADIALRIVTQLTGAGLVARRIGDDRWTVYCSRDYAARHGRPTRRSELAGHPFIGGGGRGVWDAYRAWLERNGLEHAVVMQHDTAIGLLSAVRAGVGLAVLPCFVAEQEPDLIRCLSPGPGEARSLWLVTHERLRHVPRVRVVLDFLGERLSALAKRID